MNKKEAKKKLYELTAHKLIDLVSDESWPFIGQEWSDEEEDLIADAFADLISELFKGVLNDRPKN